MTSLITEVKERIGIITLNRVDKHNAFDDEVLRELQHAMLSAIQNEAVSVIVIKANGKHFSAGADLSWMQRMVDLTEEENVAEAMILADLMYTIHYCPKPTIAMVHGSAFGGGAGIAAACDFTIAAKSAIFCFSEVRLGLIPGVISPYVIKAIGERAAKSLFISAEPFGAAEARHFGLVHHCISEDELDSFTMNFAKKITHLAPEAVCEAKKLVDQIANRPIDQKLIRETALLIAKRRVSAEAQSGLRAFLNKQKPAWNQ